MSFTADDFNLAKSRMLSELNKAMSDVENLRQAETQASEGASAAARATVEKLPGGAGAGVTGTSRTTAGTTGESAAGAADDRTTGVAQTATGAVAAGGKLSR
jgi:hypothetical protein